MRAVFIFATHRLLGQGILKSSEDVEANLSYAPERIFRLTLACDLELRHTVLGHLQDTSSFFMVDICANSYENQGMGMEGVSRKRYHGQRRSSNQYPAPAL